MNTVRVVYDGRVFNFVHRDPDDHLLSVMRSSGSFYEAELLSLLVPLVPRGATIVDIGANIGNHSVFFAGVMGCRVIAVEPNPAAAELLVRNLSLNGVADQVEIRRCAIGADRRRGRITGGGDHNLGMAAVEADPGGAVEIVPFDDLGIDDEVALIKIDVEGGEFDVLSGATNFLKTHKPILVLEIPLAKDYRRIASLLEPVGYVAGGSYNYTPTHIFRVPAKGERAAGQLVDIGHRVSLHYIDAMERVASIDRRLSALRQQVGQLTEADKSAAERLDAADRGHGRETEALARVERLLEQQKTGAAKQAEAIDVEIRSIAAAIEGFSPRMAELTAQLNGVSERVSVAEGMRAEDTEAVSALRKALERQEVDLAGRVGALGGDLADIASKFAAVATEISVLRSSLAATETRLSTAAEEGARSAAAVVADLRGVFFDASGEAQRWAQALRDEASGLSGKLDGMLSAMPSIESSLDGVSKRIVAGEERRVQDAQAITRLRKALSGQEVKAAQQTAAMESGFRKIAASLEGVVSFVPELQALSERVATRHAEAAERDARLGGALSGISEKLDALSSATAGFQQEAAGLRQEVSAQFRQEAEALRAELSAGFAALAARIDRIEQRLTATGDGIAEARKFSSDRFGLMLELQALASADMDAKLARLDARMGATVRRILEERLPARIQRGLSELATQLTQAIGVAMAERDIATEIADDTGEYDVWKAMAVLGLLESSADHAAAVEPAGAGRKVAMPTAGQALAGDATRPSLTVENGPVAAKAAQRAIGVEQAAGAALADAAVATGRAADAHEGDAPAGPPAMIGRDAANGQGPFAIRKRKPDAQLSLKTGNVWFVKGSGKLPARSPDEAPRTLETKPAAPTSSPAVVAEVPSPPAPVSETLVTLDLEEGWDRRGWGQGDTALEAGGRVVAKTACPRLGFVGPTIDCAGGGLIEAVVELGEFDQTHGVPVLRLQTESGFPVGHDFELRQGVTKVHAFAPHRTKQLRFYVLLLDARAGASFQVKRLSLSRAEAEAYRRSVRVVVGEPVLASMATIPSRREMLRDCVNSLLVQCDKVRIFLNNYPDIPDFLVHPRVEVRRSQDWDDRGDAGKFFWIDRDRDEGGYRLIVDDDLIFPPDFVEVMTGKVAAHDRHAIFATHAVLLRQPLVRYYEPSSRAVTFHFGHPLTIDRGVHIGATNALCFHSSAISMRWDDFKYCNSADVWLSLYARENRLPIFTPARPRNWVRENTHAVPGDTIYHHSLKRTRTRFDSSHVQDAVLRRAWPLTLTTGRRAKIALLLVAETAEGLSASAAHWLDVTSRCRDTTELVLLLAFDGTDALLVEAVAGLSIPHETHLVDLAKPGGELNDRISLLRKKLEFEAVVAMRESVRVVARADTSEAAKGGKGRSSTALQRADSDGAIVWSVAGDKRHLAFALSYGERGEEQIAALLGAEELVAIGLPVKRKRTGFGPADIPDAKQRDDAAELVKSQPATSELIKAARSGLLTVNDVFKRVVLLNLDRRPDRLKQAAQRLSHAGIVAERFSAIDGQAPAIAEEYAAYAAGALHEVSPELPPIAYSRDLYMNYVSQMARIAHLEKTSGRKAIASAGAWGYLRSYEAILERSLEEQDETLLVFDDDVALHKDFARLFDEAMSHLPDDWLIVQLGTLQYNWSEPWAQWRTPMLYQTNGSAIGSHAVGMRFEILPFLLDHTKRMDMPYDIGALSAATRAFPDRCFVIYPNLAIQDLGTSDIGTSDFQKSRTIQEVAAIHRWSLDDYTVSSRPRRARR